MSPEKRHHTKRHSQAAGWLLQLASRCRHSEWHICDYCSNISSTAAPGHALFGRFYGRGAATARCGAHHSVWQDLVVLQWDKTLNFHITSATPADTETARWCKMHHTALVSSRDVQMEACHTRQAVDQLISNNGAWLPSCWRQLKSPFVSNRLAVPTGRLPKRHPCAAGEMAVKMRGDSICRQLGLHQFFIW